MIDGISNSANAATAARTNKSILGKDDFMKLMIQQLKNQDPLNPMDGTAFASQLAEFSSLEQLSNMNDAIETSINANYQLTQSINNSMSAALIGKAVKLVGNDVNYQGQENIDLGYYLAGDAKNVSMKIYDENGTLVKTYENIKNIKGDHKLSWDFTDNEGKKLGYGSYSFEIEATSMSGDTIQADTYRVGPIDSIRFTEYGTMLVINNVEYSLNDVFEILNFEDSDNTNNDGEKTSNGR